MWTSQGEQIPGVGQGGYYANVIATARSCRRVDLVFHVLLAIISGWWCHDGCTLGRKVWCKCVGVAENHLPSSFYSHSFKLNSLVSEKLWSDSMFYLYCKMSLSCCFAFTVCMFFLDPTVKIESTTMRLLHRIFHIMFFVATHSM